MYVEIRVFKGSISNCTGFVSHGERAARAYDGGLGEHPSGVQVPEPPVGVRQEKNPTAECLFVFCVSKEGQAANLKFASLLILTKTLIHTMILFGCQLK